MTKQVYNTKIVTIKDLAHPRQELAEAVALLRQNQVVAFPTETVYGLGALGLSTEAVATLYQTKGRPRNKAFSLQIPHVSMLPELVTKVPEMASKLLQAFAPGPLTVILPKKDHIPDIVTGGKNTVGIRIPQQPVALALLQLLGEPLAVPSANISGHRSPCSAQEVWEDLQGRIPLIVDGGPCAVGQESTIVDCTGNQPVIVRQGAISLEAIQQVLPDYEVSVLGDNK